MKKLSAILMAVLFFGCTGLVLADSSSPKLTKTVKHHKGRKHKPALNPQPLPPRKVPVDGAQAGPGGLKPQ